MIIGLTYVAGNKDAKIASSNTLNENQKETICKAILQKIRNLLVDWDNEIFYIENISSNEFRYQLKPYTMIYALFPKLSIAFTKDTSMRIFHKGHIKVYHYGNSVFRIEYKLFSYFWLLSAIAILTPFMTIATISLLVSKFTHSLALSDIFKPLMFILILPPVFLYTASYIIFFLISVLEFQYKLNKICKLIEEIPNIEGINLE